MTGVSGGRVGPRKSSAWRAFTSFGLCILSAVLVFVWQRLFEYSPESRVSLLFGVLRPTTNTVIYVGSGVLGALGFSSLLSFDSLRALLRHLLGAWESLGDDAKQFWNLPGVLVVSVALFGLSTNLVITNWSLTLSTDFEILVTLVDLEAADSPDPDSGQERREVRLQPGERLRVHLKGLNASAILVVRDKLSLVPINSLCLDRKPWAQVDPCTIGGGLLPIDGETSRWVRTGILGRRLRGGPKWKQVEVSNPIFAGSLYEGGIIQAAEPVSGPENPRYAYTSRFLHILYWQREDLQRWLYLPSAMVEGNPGVTLKIWGYDLAIEFQEVTVENFDGTSVPVRVATVLHATELEILQND